MAKSEGPRKLKPMPVIRRPRQKDQISVAVGANLLHALQDAGIAVASSCGGDAVCGKCVIKILNGQENLTPPQEDELFLIEKDQIQAPFRVSCQCAVLGDIDIDATYW